VLQGQKKKQDLKQLDEERNLDKMHSMKKLFRHVEQRDKGNKKVEKKKQGGG